MDQVNNAVGVASVAASLASMYMGNRRNTQLEQANERLAEKERERAEIERRLNEATERINEQATERRQQMETEKEWERRRREEELEQQKQLANLKVDLEKKTADMNYLKEYRDGLTKQLAREREKAQQLRSENERLVDTNTSIRQESAHSEHQATIKCFEQQINYERDLQQAQMEIVHFEEQRRNTLYNSLRESFNSLTRITNSDIVAILQNNMQIVEERNKLPGVGSRLAILVLVAILIVHISFTPSMTLLFLAIISVCWLSGYTLWPGSQESNVSKRLSELISEIKVAIEHQIPLERAEDILGGDQLTAIQSTLIERRQILNTLLKTTQEISVSQNSGLLNSEKVDSLRSSFEAASTFLSNNQTCILLPLNTPTTSLGKVEPPAIAEEITPPPPAILHAPSQE